MQRVFGKRIRELSLSIESRAIPAKPQLSLSLSPTLSVARVLLRGNAATMGLTHLIVHHEVVGGIT